MELQEIQKLANQHGVQLTQEAISRMYASPEGQRLLALLNQDGGTAARAAVDAISTGDQAGARQALSQLLSSPDAAALLKQLGR